MQKIILTFEAGSHMMVREYETWSDVQKTVKIYKYPTPANASDALVKRTRVTNKTEVFEVPTTVEYEFGDYDPNAWSSGISDDFFEGVECTTAVVTEGVTHLGGGLFDNCKQLTAITLPSTLQEMKGYIFRGCDALQRIVVPTSVISATNSFVHFDFSKVELATGRTVVPVGFFSGVDNMLLDYTLPEGITQIKDVVGDGMSLKGINFPSTMKKIDQLVFTHSKLSHLEWPENVPVTDQDISLTGEGFCTLEFMPLSETPDTLFIHENFNCDTLIIPANVKKIVFPERDSYVVTLRHIHVDPVNTLYDSRENCNAVIETATGKMILAGALTKVPEGVTSIEDTARGIQRAEVCPVMPDTLKKVECDFGRFKEITLTPVLLKALHDGNAKGLHKFNGMLIVAPDTKELPDSGDINNGWNDKSGKFCEDCHITELVLQDGLEKIGDGFFSGCTIDGEIKLPQSLKRIGSYAFANLKRSVDTPFVIPDGVTEIGESAFADWTPTDVVLPASLEVLNDLFSPSSQNGSKHSSLDVPANVKKVACEHFKDFDKITFHSPEAPIFTIDKVEKLSKGKIYFPKGADYSSLQPIFNGWTFKELKK